MKTYWVITVKDPGDHEAGISRYERRFEFGDLEEALECALGAQKAGFTVSTAKVSATPGNRPDPASRERWKVGSVRPHLPPLHMQPGGRRAHGDPRD